MEKVVTKNFKETKELGKKLVSNLQGGEVICLSGDLGSGKTTFTQGVLEGLGAEKPYTSPTFMILKKYEIRKNLKIKKVFHIDTYRVEANDILDLGWEEIINNPENIVIVEWPERIQNILPKNYQQINFKWKNEKEREIIFEI